MQLDAEQEPCRVINGKSGRILVVEFNKRAPASEISRRARMLETSIFSIIIIIVVVVMLCYYYYYYYFRPFDRKFVTIT